MYAHICIIGSVPLRYYRASSRDLQRLEFNPLPYVS